MDKARGVKGKRQEKCHGTECQRSEDTDDQRYRRSKSGMGKIITCHGCGSERHLIKDCRIPRPIPYRTREERQELARRWKLQETIPTYRARYESPRTTMNTKTMKGTAEGTRKKKNQEEQRNPFRRGTDVETRDEEGRDVG